MSNFIVCLDAGHGGHDPGAVGNGLREKDITLDIAKRCEALLAINPQVKCIMTRETDVFIPIGTRARIANEARVDVFISIHVNGFDDPGAHGFEIYMRRDAPGGDQSVVLKRLIHARLAPIWIAQRSIDRGKKSAGYQVIRTTHMPAVLTEHGFITNPHDAALLKRDNFLQSQAEAIISGVYAFLGIDVPSTSLPDLPVASSYRVRVNDRQIGAYRNAENIGNLVKLELAKDVNKIEIERVAS